MTTLLIDNYDSFTYNLYALIAMTTGTPPIVVRNDASDWSSVSKLDVDRIIISPGPGRPQRRTDLGLSADAILLSEIPVLGVCLGHQAIGHLFGAKVDRALEPVHGRLCSVSHVGKDLFEGIASPFSVVRYHSLAVSKIPSVLETTAWAPDGTIMALRHKERPLWGVQFHPESICSENGARLIRRFFDLTEQKSSISKANRLPEIERQTRPGPTGTLKLYSVRVDSAPTPDRAFKQIFGRSPTAFWLDSGASQKGHSYMGDIGGPLSELVRYDAATQTLTVQRDGTTRTSSEDLLSYLERTLTTRRPIESERRLDFAGGYVGYFGYECDDVARGSQPTDDRVPDAAWIFADRFIAVDHATGETWLHCLDDKNGVCSENQAWMDTVRAALKTAADNSTPEAYDVPASGAHLRDLKWRHNRKEYCALIDVALQAIHDGESYEVCLTNQLTAECDADPLALYESLRRVNPAPYAAFLRVGSLAILCSSPELFLRISATGDVESKPMKGTAPRNADPAIDQQLAHTLATSVKDKSENLMIVDLLRNDLNRVCAIGSVEVPHMFSVESYASVHQMVSTIRGRLRPDSSPLDCIRSAFPGGSMTGAPKVRTMQILRGLEGGRRGIYSGSLGYLSVTGSAQLNIVIRTIVLDGARLSIGTGGAIVALSDPQLEFDEIELKVKALLRAIQGVVAPRGIGDLRVGNSGG